MAALSQIIPSGLYSPDGHSPALLAAASAFGAQAERNAAQFPSAFSMAESSLAQKFHMGSQPSNMPFIPAPAEGKKIKLYSRDYYAVRNACLADLHLACTAFAESCGLKDLAHCHR